jgi:hypothetical protein
MGRFAVAAVVAICDGFFVCGCGFAMGLVCVW